MKKTVGLLFAITLVLASCGGSDSQKAAEDMLKQAEKYFSEGYYDRAKIAIDSLRKVYPGAVETRKKALKLFQDISLKEAQRLLPRLHRSGIHLTQRVDGNLGAVVAALAEILLCLHEHVLGSFLGVIAAA